jgi:plastocyanin
MTAQTGGTGGVAPDRRGLGNRPGSPIRTGTVRGSAPRLTWGLGALMLAAALAIFAVAYVVGGVFGRDADRKVDDAGASTVAALDPSGTPLLTVIAKGIAFDTERIAVPAGQPVQLRLDNEDAGVLHNIAVYRDDRASDLVVRGKLFDGPRERDYRFEAMPAGTYYFQCDLHPAMNGTLTAQ